MTETIPHSFLIILLGYGLGDYVTNEVIDENGLGRSTGSGNAAFAVEQSTNALKQFFVKLESRVSNKFSASCYSHSTEHSLEIGTYWKIFRNIFIRTEAARR